MKLKFPKNQIPREGPEFRDWLTARGLTLLGVKLSTDDKDAEINISETLTDQQILALAAALTEISKVASVTGALGEKPGQVAALESSVRTMIESRYPAHRQRTLSHLLAQAKADGLTNRASYIQALWTWLELVFAYYYTKEDEINAAQDPNTVTWDLSSLESNDPLISIRDALAIVN